MLNIDSVVRLKAAMLAIVGYLDTTTCTISQLSDALNESYKFGGITKREHIILYRIFSMYKATKADKLTDSEDLLYFRDLLKDFVGTSLNQDQVLDYSYKVYVNNNKITEHALALFIRYVVIQSVMRDVFIMSFGVTTNRDELQKSSQSVIESFMDRANVEPYRALNVFTPTTISILNNIFGLKISRNTNKQR